MKNLAAAYIKAQQEMAPLLKDTKGNFGKYSTLANVQEVCLSAFGNHGIAVFQNVATDWEDQRVYVRIACTLMHAESEESRIMAEISLVPAKTDPQGIGSAITYGRRYTLMAAAGIAPEDDDGTLASNGQIHAPQRQNVQTQRQPSASQAPANAHRNTQEPPPPATPPEPPAEQNDHPFDDPDAGVQAQRRQKLEAMTEKAMQWRKLDDATDPCSTAQYGYFVSVVESITGKGTHPQAFNVMFKRVIDGDNRPGKKAVQWLFDILPEQVTEKDAAGKPVKNESGKNVYVTNTKRDQVAVDTVKELYALAIKQQAQPNKMAV